MLNQPTLFGKYRFAKDSATANLFGNSFVAQAFTLTASDSVAGTDTDKVTALKALSDALGLTETQAKALLHTLADTVTGSDALSRHVNHALSETVGFADGQTIATDKQLSEFLILKEWVALRLKRGHVWAGPAAGAASWNAASVVPAAFWQTPNPNRGINHTLFAKQTFGTRLFAAVKPPALWVEGTKRPENWTQTDGHKYSD